MIRCIRISSATPHPHHTYETFKINCYANVLGCSSMSSCTTNNYGPTAITSKCSNKWQCCRTSAGVAFHLDADFESFNASGSAWMDGLGGGGLRWLFRKWKSQLHMLFREQFYPQKNLVNKVFFILFFWEFVSLLYFYFT